MIRQQHLIQSLYSASPATAQIINFDIEFNVEKNVVTLPTTSLSQLVAEGSNILIETSEDDESNIKEILQSAILDRLKMKTDFLAMVSIKSELHLKLKGDDHVYTGIPCTSHGSYIAAPEFEYNIAECMDEIPIPDSALFTSLKSLAVNNGTFEFFIDINADYIDFISMPVDPSVERIRIKNLLLIL